MKKRAALSALALAAVVAACGDRPGTLEPGTPDDVRILAPGATWPQGLPATQFEVSDLDDEGGATCGSTSPSPPSWRRTR